MTWRNPVLYLSTMTASAFGTNTLYLDFSKFVIGSHSTGTPMSVKAEFTVSLAVCLIGLGFSFKKTFESFAKTLDENL